MENYFKKLEQAAYKYYIERESLTDVASWWGISKENLKKCLRARISVNIEKVDFKVDDNMKKDLMKMTEYAYEYEKEVA